MNNPAAANRVAATIATFKWIVIGILLIVAVLFFVASLSSGDANGIMLGLVTVIGIGLYALVSWVLFGWFEQTLRMLATIAHNTSSTPGEPTWGR